MKKRLLPFLSLAMAIFLGWSAAASAQSIGGILNPEKSSPAPVATVDPYGRETPRSTMKGFVKKASQGKYSASLAFLELDPTWPEAKSLEIARNLELLLDRFYPDDIEALNNTSEGSLEDGQPANFDSAGTIDVDGEKLSVRLVRKVDPNTGPYWQVAATTLMDVEQIADRIPESGVERYIHSPTLKRKVGNVPLWLILATLILVLPLYFVSWLIVHGLMAVFRLAKRAAGRKLSPHQSKAARPFVWMLTFILHYVILAILGLPLYYRQKYMHLLQLLVLFLFGWLLSILVEVLGQRYRERLSKIGKRDAQSALIVAQKLLKAIIFGALLLAVIRFLGYNINAALATLGIGGLALAFAAQKTLESLFGGLSLLSDQALRVGDTCQFGSQRGTVEDIGLRSTLFRTPDRTTLLVPNAVLANQNLENLSRRDKYQFKQTVGLRYETKSEQLLQVTNGIQEALKAHKKVEVGSERVRFVRLGASSLDLELQANILTRQENEFMEVQQELLLEVMRVVETAGAEFAFPSQTIYLEQDAATPA